jgi:uncharacterized membrane protein YsdA (DUF1294 family)
MPYFPAMVVPIASTGRDDGMADTPVWFLVVLAYLGVNGLAYVAFFWDKSCAINGRGPVRESRLLQLAFIGGPGAKLGQLAFRHKTHKQPFANRLNGTVALHLVFVGLILTAMTVPAVRNGISFGAEIMSGWFDPPEIAEVVEEPEPPVMPRRFGPGS